MKGRIALVTGFTAGIGKVTARELARRGATVVAVARDAARGQAAVDEIRGETGNADVHLLTCDFSSQADIRRLVADYRARYDRLHVLVNNAGGVLAERRLTVDGIEATFATNHLGYFLLTSLLLDVIKASAPARIVSVASEAHRGAKLDFDDLQYARRSYLSLDVYGASKLANVVWSAELARRLEGTGVTANSLHPGVIKSNFGQSGPGWMRFGIKLIRPFMITSEQGAETSLYLATSPDVEKVTGKYFSKKKERTPSKRARDPETGPRLWAVSEALVAKSAAATAA
jgi:NAD(P)-dependent dehydrogenase (short-subunit alcohol dehydrogenase family)